MMSSVNLLMSDMSFTKRIEYILEENLLEKSVKRPFCCTVSILLYNLFGPGIHFIENLKLMLIENQIMIWFHN